ncbi:hypothetical protein HRG_010310 [Hirsutella rhossiliensis]|uniref:Peroxin 20 n=1 Tax=Hirsutella rhossiliensis TaxID=111463 RepID=A0A9P8SDD7_9HYPO|nr:uncharacterized protein HRG_10310 [Hirsutella rhossiliensis]KAH0958623.1 hypothetical protein HRG_10310 [Hirsutella rhossiliensis]
MAEASCSGGTPFKRLIDHQSRDVSHHQDRLVDRSGVNGRASFRSVHGHAAPGQQSFDAFMNEPPSAASAFSTLPLDPASRLAVHAAALQSPLAHTEFVHARASPAPDVSGWAADFGRFSSQQQMRAAAPAPVMHMAQHQQSPSSMLNFRTAFGQPGPAFAPLIDRGSMAPAPPLESGFDQEMARWMASHGGGSMSDVDAAMDQMARELELNESALPETSMAEAATESSVAQKTAPATHFTDLETPEISKLSLRDPATGPQAPLHAPQVLESVQQDQQGADDTAALDKSAVSEAAERLLESVQHEDGEKWQNSVFLSLMRDFRDGRKDIVENEIRQTAGPSGGEAAENQALT